MYLLFGEIHNLDVLETLVPGEVEGIFEDTEPRVEKSLLNTFPFNQFNNDKNQEHHEGHHNDHSEGHDGHHEGQQSNSLEGVDLSSLLSRQYGPIITTEPPIITTEKKCIPKIMLVEETEYDIVVTCDHSYDQRSVGVQCRWF